MYYVKTIVPTFVPTLVPTLGTLGTYFCAYFYIVKSPTFHLLFVNSPTFICSMFYTFSTTLFTFLKTLILPHLRGDDQNCPHSLSHLRGDDQNCPRTLILPLLLGPCLGFFWNIAALICQT